MLAYAYTVGPTRRRELVDLWAYVKPVQEGTMADSNNTIKWPTKNEARCLRRPTTNEARQCYYRPRRPVPDIAWPTGAWICWNQGKIPSPIFDECILATVCKTVRIRLLFECDPPFVFWRLCQPVQGHYVNDARLDF